jgi:hypothetical protein
LSSFICAGLFFLKLGSLSLTGKNINEKRRKRKVDMISTRMDDCGETVKEPHNGTGQQRC